MLKNNFKLVFFGLALIVLLLASFFGGAIVDRMYFLKSSDIGSQGLNLTSDENSVINVVEKASKSVVTVSVQTPERRVLQYNPFEGFSTRVQEEEDHDIGSGFLVEGGLVITNKHVVSSQAEYKVITQDGKEHKVTEVIRDEANDLAILKAESLESYEALTLGESNNLKVGQSVIAIGTALGEFRHTVTTGVVSGLGRGIVAGDAYAGYAERLDDLIQTDAAINPGNSGGPLLNSRGEVIGVNVAVSQGAQNIGFALPIDLVKKGLAQFNKSGNFASKPFLGVEHAMITKDAAVLNSLPQGAYILNVVEGSSADNAGIQKEDIIVKINDQSVAGSEEGLSDMIAKFEVGETVKIEIWRNGETIILDNVALNAKSSE